MSKQGVFFRLGFGMGAERELFRGSLTAACCKKQLIIGKNQSVPADLG